MSALYEQTQRMNYQAHLQAAERAIEAGRLEDARESVGYARAIATGRMEKLTSALWTLFVMASYNDWRDKRDECDRLLRRIDTLESDL